MLDKDLAILYGLSTSRLNEQVRRNAGRFPENFSFYLTADETRNWISQNATSKSIKMGLRKPPRVFTEYGVAMALVCVFKDGQFGGGCVGKTGYRRLRAGFIAFNQMSQITLVTAHSPFRQTNGLQSPKKFKRATASFSILFSPFSILLFIN